MSEFRCQLCLISPEERKLPQDESIYTMKGFFLNQNNSQTMVQICYCCFSFNSEIKINQLIPIHGRDFLITKIKLNTKT